MSKRLVAGRDDISPFTPLPSMVHYHLIWSLFWGGLVGKGRCGGAEKSLSLKSQRKGRGYCVCVQAERGRRKGVRCINGVERERGLNPPSIYPSLLSHTLFTSMVGGGCLDVRV